MLKKSIKGKDVFHPKAIAMHTNKYKTMNAEYLNHNDSKRPFFVGWEKTGLYSILLTISIF